MAHESVGLIFVSTLLANNFVLAMFLGLCPFLGVSARLDTAFPMGIAVDGRGRVYIADTANDRVQIWSY